jgi:hypothetical protein
MRENGNVGGGLYVPVFHSQNSPTEFDYTFDHFKVQVTVCTPALILQIFVFPPTEYNYGYIFVGYFTIPSASRLY